METWGWGGCTVVMGCSMGSFPEGACSPQTHVQGFLYDLEVLQDVGVDGVITGIPVPLDGGHR